MQDNYDAHHYIVHLLYKFSSFLVYLPFDKELPLGFLCISRQTSLCEIKGFFQLS